MSFLRHQRSIVRWEFEAGPGANQAAAPLPPSHRLDESRPLIPWRVALQQTPPPLHQPVSSSPRSAGNVNCDRTQVAEFSTGIMRNFQPVLTLATKIGQYPSPLAHLDSVNVQAGQLPAARRSPAATPKSRSPASL